jgi:hypothetical protein
VIYLLSSSYGAVRGYIYKSPAKAIYLSHDSYPQIWRYLPGKFSYRRDILIFIVFEFLLPIHTCRLVGLEVA